MNTNNNNSESTHSLPIIGCSQLYLTRAGDRERILEFYEYYKDMSLEKLVASYNQNQKTGMLGVHAQGLAMIALNHAFNKLCDRSPILIQENCIIGFGKPIVVNNGNWEYEG